MALFLKYVRSKQRLWTLACGGFGIEEKEILEAGTLTDSGAPRGPEGVLNNSISSGDTLKL